MAEFRNKTTVTYSRKAQQCVSDAQVKTITAGPSTSRLHACSSASDEASIKPKAGTLHAYLHKLPPSVGFKRKAVSDHFGILFTVNVSMPMTLPLDAALRTALHLR